MILTKDQAYKLCSKEGIAFKVDPLLIMAIIEQESSYDTEATRLENAFDTRVRKKYNYATTTEILMGCSYGLMQMLGDSLLAVGYLKSRFYEMSAQAQRFYDNDPMHEIAFVKAINGLMVTPEDQVHWGAKWFVDEKLNRLAKGDINKALLFWNGGGNPNYPTEVLNRMVGLRAIYPGKV